MTKAAAADIEVTASLRDGNTQLEIEWSVTNRGARSLLALVQPLQHNDSPAATTIYLAQDADDVAEFALRSFAVPEGINPAVLDRIGAQPLAAGAVLRGRAVMAFPLSVNAPYQSPQVLPAIVRKARVCIGVLDADARIPISSRSGGGAIATYHDARVASAQQIACSAPLALPGH